MAPGNVNEVGLKRVEASAWSGSELCQTQARLSSQGIPLPLRAGGTAAENVSAIDQTFKCSFQGTIQSIQRQTQHSALYNVHPLGRNENHWPGRHTPRPPVPRSLVFNQWIYQQTSQSGASYEPIRSRVNRAAPATSSLGVKSRQKSLFSIMPYLQTVTK